MPSVNIIVLRVKGVLGLASCTFFNMFNYDEYDDKLNKLCFNS